MNESEIHIMIVFTWFSLHDSRAAASRSAPDGLEPRSSKKMEPQGMVDVSTEFRFGVGFCAMPICSRAQAVHHRSSRPTVHRHHRERILPAFWLDCDKRRMHLLPQKISLVENSN